MRWIVPYVNFKEQYKIYGKITQEHFKKLWLMEILYLEMK